MTRCHSSSISFPPRVHLLTKSTNISCVRKVVLLLLRHFFAVNIETNGNPHHHPWSIGKRLLSSWLPVRSAKDQEGAKVGDTHIVRWKPRPNGTSSHLSQSSLASMDSDSARSGLFQIETSSTSLMSKSNWEKNTASYVLSLVLQHLELHC